MKFCDFSQNFVGIILLILHIFASSQEVWFFLEPFSLQEFYWMKLKNWLKLLWRFITNVRKFLKMKLFKPNSYNSIAWILPMILIGYFVMVIDSEMPYSQTHPAEWRHWRRSGVFIVNFEQISHIVLVFLLSTLNK